MGGVSGHAARRDSCSFVHKMCEGVAKAAAKADVEGVVDLGGGAFVRRPIAGAIEQGHDLGGIGQRDDERMITPGAVEGDVHAFLARTRGFDEGAVAIEDGFVEELGRLPLPDLDADFVDGMQESADVAGVEAAAEITGGGGIRNAPGAEGVEIDGVIAAEFEILEGDAAAQRIIGEIEDMIGFVIGQMDLEGMQALVDDLGQAETLDHEMDGADAAAVEAMAALAEFVVDVACGELRPVAARQYVFVQTPLDPSLAVAPHSLYSWSHSKSLLASGNEKVELLIKHRKTKRISSFIISDQKRVRKLRLVKA